MGFYSNMPVTVPGRQPENAPPRLLNVVAGHRDYNPEIGRWNSKDPIGEKGGERLHRYSHKIVNSRYIRTKSSLNLFSFVENFVLNSFDILGLIACQAECTAAANAVAEQFESAVKEQQPRSYNMECSAEGNWDEYDPYEVKRYLSGKTQLPLIRLQTKGCDRLCKGTIRWIGFKHLVASGVCSYKVWCLDLLASDKDGMPVTFGFEGSFGVHAESIDKEFFEESSDFIGLCDVDWDEVYVRPIIDSQRGIVFPEPSP